MKRFILALISLFISFSMLSQTQMIINKNNGPADSIFLSQIKNITFKSSAVAVPTDSLVAFWPLNGNANDSSGNGHNGTINGGLTWTSNRFGNPNTAANFNGTDSWIDLGNTHPLITNFSISLWIKPAVRATTSGPGLIGDAGGYKGFRVYQINDSLYFEAQNTGENYSSPDWGMSTSAVGQWVHLVGTNQNGTVKLYINGLIFKTLVGGAGNASTLNLEMGRDTNLNSLYWQGALDDVRIYNKVLSDAEVLALYNSQ